MFSRGSIVLLAALQPIVSVAAHVTVGQATVSALTVKDCSYGDVYQFSPASCHATLENSGDTPLNLMIVPVQPGTHAEPEKLILQSHTKAEVELYALTDNVAGAIAWTYRIDGAGGDEPVFAHATGFIQSVLDDAHPSIVFGSVDPKAPITKSIAFVSSPYSSVRITKIVAASDYLHVRIAKDGKKLVAEIGPDAPWGTIDEFVKVAIDTPVQKEVWVQVTADVKGEIGPKKNPLWLSGIPWGQRGDVKVPLIDQSGRDFKIVDVTSKDLAATYDNAPCDPPAPGCRNLLVRIADSQAAGLFRVQLDVAFADRKNHLHLGLWGILGEPLRLGDEADIPTGPKPLPVVPTSSEAVPPLKVQADPPGEGPLLKWTIANQSSVQGYQVYRSASSDGPFALMEPGLIQTLDNRNGPVAYRWRDTSAVKGQTYWYYIAVVYKSGDRHALSALQKTVAK
jgi:hypothetical protein